jgi:hypothetical protein
MALRQEELDDVRRHIAELIAQILVGLVPVDVGAIEERAAIGSDASANEWPGRHVHDLLLPGFEADPPPMLRARTVLGKDAGEMRG